MAKREERPQSGAEVRRDSYKGHEIVYPVGAARRKVFIDGRPVRWGQAGDTVYLDVYAYDRGATLEETIRRYIDSRAKKASARREK